MIFLEINNMTRGAMLSAAFVVTSILAIAVGFGYLGYIDFIVPAFIAVIYLKCDLKYTILSCVTSLILIVFVIGNIPSSIFMSQSMILGIIIARLILKERTIFDDLFLGAIAACFVMILIDINFSVLTNYSFIKESQEYIKLISEMPQFSVLTDTAKDVIYYTSIAVLPLGTIFIIYFISLFAGKKLKALNKQGMRKYTILRNFKKYGAYISLSNRSLIIGSIYVVIVFMVEKSQLLENFAYTMVLLKCTEYIVLFFIVQDSFNFVNKLILAITRSSGTCIISQFIIFICLINKFTITSICLILGNLFIQKKFNIKEKQNKILYHIIENNMV